MRGRSACLAVLVLLLSCGGNERFTARVKFPDEQARALARLLRVMAIQPGEGATCQALRDGSASPNDDGYDLENQAEVPLDRSEKGEALKVPGKGMRFFYAEVEDWGSQVFLRGCTEVDVGGKEARVVVILLEWVEKPCQAEADCDDRNSCTTDLCEHQWCQWDELADGEPCDDGDLCTVGDACDAVACVSGSRGKDADSDSHIDAVCAGDDCDDTDDQIHPGISEDTATPLFCQDGKDNDCDGLTDGEDTTCPPYYRWITIGPGQVAGTADLADFPVLVAVWDDPLLMTTANGGHVAHDAGYDILFFDSDGTTPLDFEIEEYDGTLGMLTAWVRVPTLSASSDTILFMQYGDDSIDASRENPAGVWDADYVAVFHLHQDPSGPAPQFSDSTANGFHGTNEGGLVPADRYPGKIGKCMVFQHDPDDWISVPPELKATGSEVTAEAWMFSPDWDVSVDAAAINTGGVLNTERFFVGTDRTGILCIRVTTDVQHYRYDQGPLPIDEWVHVVTRYDGTALKGYVNGVEVQSWDASGTILDTDAPGRIGARFDDRRLYGALDEIRVSDIARPVEWIQTGYNNQSSPATFLSIGPEF